MLNFENLSIGDYVVEEIFQHMHIQTRKLLVVSKPIFTATFYASGIWSCDVKTEDGILIKEYYLGFQISEIISKNLNPYGYLKQ